MVSPKEAEAQCAFLEIAGLTEGRPTGEDMPLHHFQGRGQTERRHLEKYAAAELPPTPPRPSLSVRQPDKDGGAGRGWQLDDDVTANVS